jgi:hypothetical protein
MPRHSSPIALKRAESICNDCKAIFAPIHVEILLFLLLFSPSRVIPKQFEKSYLQSLISDFSPPLPLSVICWSEGENAEMLKRWVFDTNRDIYCGTGIAGEVSVELLISFG